MNDFKDRQRFLKGVTARQESVTNDAEDDGPSATEYSADLQKDNSGGEERPQASIWVYLEPSAPELGSRCMHGLHGGR
jgi:hypothetical protein